MTPKEAAAPARGRLIGRQALRVLRAVTALLVLGFLAGWYVLETDAAASYVLEFIAARGEAALGEPVTIGRLELDVLPPRLELHDVQIGDLPDALLTVDRVLAEFGAVELLARQIAIENIELDRPHINLQLPFGDGAAASDALDITVRRARVVDGEVRLGLASAGIDGEIFGVTVQLDPEGVGRLGLGTGRGAGQLRIDSGQLDLTSRNGATALLTPLEVAVDYGTRPRVTDLDLIRLSIGESSFEAEGMLRGFNNLDLELRADVALNDIFKMWVPPGIQDHGGRATFTGTVQMRDGAPVLAGRLASPAGRFMGLDVENFATDLQLRRGLVALRNVRSEVHGGDLSGSLTVDLSAQPGVVRADYVAAGIDAARFTDWDQLAGLRLAGSLDSSGDLEWQQPFLETATGSGSFRIQLPDVRTVVTVPVELGNSTVVAVGQRIQAPALPLPGDLSLRYSIAGGTIDVQSATANLPGAHLELAGTVDLDGALAIEATFEGSDLRILDHLAAQARTIAGQPAERFGLRGAGTAEVQLGGTVQAPLLTGSVTARQLAIADLRIGDIDAELETTDGMVATRTLRLRRGAGEGTGFARLRLPARGDGASLGLADYDVQLALTNFPASLDLQFAGPEWNVDATVTGDFGLRGLFGQPLTGAAQLSGTDVQFAGARFDSLTLSGRKAEEAWLVDRIALGTNDSEGNGQVSASLLYGPAERLLTLDAELERFHLAPFAEFLGMSTGITGPVDGTLNLDGPVAALTGTGTLRWTDATISNVALGAVAVSLRADDGVIAARAVGAPGAMPAPPGIARTAAAQAAPLPPLAAAGWVASASFQTLFPYPTAARVAADAQIATVLLGPLGVQLPQDMVLRGQADIDITGALAAPDQLRGSGSIRDLVIERGGFAARADSLAASIDESQILINGTVETDGGSVVISPRFDLTTGELGGHLRGRLPASAVHLYNPALIAEGHFELNIELAGTSTAPRLMGSLTASDVLVDADWPYPLHVEAARVEATGDRLHVTDFEGALGNHPLSLTADIALDTITSSTSTAISTLAMTIDGLALQPLLARAPAIESLVNGGSISAALRLEGNGLDPRAWEGEIVLSELGLRMDQYRAELADPIVATLGGGTLSLPPATRLVGGNTDLGLRGDINLDTFAIDLYADGTFGFEALNMLSPYWGTGGVADLDLRVYGDGGNPAYQGFATLRDMVLLPPVIRQPVEDISARLDFEGRRILISDVRGALGGGDVTGNGEVFLRNNYPQSFRLDVRVDGAVIRLERDVRFTASANLVHDGTPDRSLLSGTIDLIETQYGREYDSDRALLEMLDAPETEPNPFLDSINLALALRGTEDIFIDNNLADVEAAADFDVRGTAARPVVLGRASILSGRLFWNGNNFDVLQGTVEFNNPFETEATFEVRSRTEIRRYTIDMRFSGSLTRGVDFDYTSTPTLSDLELFNLLAFGEEPDSTTLQDPDRYQQALGLQATRYLTDAYFSEVESGARRLFGVDRFRISPTISGKETDATARVTLGKRINRNVYLTYSRLLSTSEDQLITVEYQVSPRLRIKGTRDEDGSFGIDFLVQQRIRR